MVLVEVEGLIFDIDNKHIIGSKTIENFLQYCNTGDNVQTQMVIPLNVSLNLWYEYLQFLDDNNDDSYQPTIGTLKVIDYVDNELQAKIWCELYCKQLRNEDWSLATFNNSVLTKIINQNTQFIPQHILPFDLLDTFESILYRVRQLSSTCLQQHYICHIVKTLFSFYITNKHYNITKIKNIIDIPHDNITDMINNKFILQTKIKIGGVETINSNAVLYPSTNYYYSTDFGEYKLNLLGETVFISPRIAVHYDSVTLY